MKKTKWQWLSATTFFTGVVSNGLGVYTNSAFFIIATLLLWGIALWCVIYKPVGVTK